MKPLYCFLRFLFWGTLFNSALVANKAVYILKLTTPIVTVGQTYFVIGDKLQLLDLSLDTYLLQLLSSFKG